MAATTFTDEQVLQALADNPEGLTALAIALSIDEDAEKDSVKIINPILYRLLRERKVHKSEAKKGAPVWIGISEEEKEQDSLVKDTVTSKLKTDKWISTTKLIELCALAGCPKLKLRTKVNAVLYAMDKAGTVEKQAEADGTKPHWRKLVA